MKSKKNTAKLKSSRSRMPKWFLLDEEMKELSDQTYVPTLVAGDEVLANFDTDQLDKFLREHQIEP